MRDISIMFTLNKFKVKVLAKVVLSKVLRKRLILTRTACLGSSVVNATFDDGLIINYQKYRVDFIIGDERYNVANKNITSMIKRSDLKKLILSQSTARLVWDVLSKFVKPDYIVLDTYSELTDQLFESEHDGGSFCANYSDVDIQEALKLGYKCSGLLELKEIEYKYQRLFETIESKFSNDIPIVFINFNTALDHRDKFKKRSLLILNALKGIEHSKKFNLKVISVEDQYISGHSDGFPYHFDVETKNIFTDKLDVKLREFSEKSDF
ncbi:TPA: hypothetical protein ACN361_001946 [Vibrio parahaemolyticus]